MTVLRSVLRSLAALALFLFTAASAHAEQKDISFFVVGKSPRYEQDMDGRLHQAGYYLFAEIFLHPGGTVSEARLAYPGGIASDFTAKGTAHRIKRRDFDSLAALDAAYPDGDYVLTVKSPSGAVNDLSVRLGGTRVFPDPIEIRFFQDGKRVRQAAIVPGKDLILRWTPFRTGGEDPRGILGDISFAMVSDCKGVYLARTALPFDPIPALTYRDTSFRIPGERLKAGARYKVVLEHAKMADTKMQDGIYGLAAFPTVTHSYIETTGDKDGTCKGTW